MIKPRKKWALFSNYLQSTAADLVTIKVQMIKDFLETNNFKSKLLFQVHDSFVFDICCEEEKHIISSIVNIMSEFNGYILPISIKKGKNYFHLNNI